MAATKPPYHSQSRDLALLVIAVAGESVGMIKRSAPEKALGMKRQREWDIYLEFLKMLLNVADRMSSLFLPVQEQPLFMDNLVDEIVHQLKGTLGPAFGQASDEMEMVLAIETAVSESRQVYEPFRFVVTEESKAKEDWYQLFGSRLERLIGEQDRGVVASTATLCISSVIPAMKALFEGISPQAPQGPMDTRSEEAAQTAVRREAPASSATAHGPASGAAADPRTGNEIKLLSIMATVEGEEVETRWGLHPRFRRDLKPRQVQELTRLMNRVTQIVGTRYAEVAFSEKWAAWRTIGHA